MKLNRLALLVAISAPMAMAHAGFTITPFVGYQHDKPAEKKQLEKFGYAKDEGAYLGLGLGAEINPSMAVEFEYARSDDKINKVAGGAAPATKMKQQNASVNFMVNSDLFTQNYDGAFKPYALIGVGMGSYDAKNSSGTTVADEDSVIGNLGLGSFLRFSDNVALRTEIRGMYNFDKNWLEPVVLAGLQGTIGGHLKPVIPEPPMPEPEPVKPEPVIIKKVQPVDSDGDGVIDRLDRCPNTPRGTIVDAVGCPKAKEMLKMELRVFFDVNKSNIKAQYRPEIAKVANTMRQYPQTTAMIEGHTSKTGPRRLNERLSLARANAVKNMLANQYGVNPARLATRGYAWDRPIAPNNTAEGRALNRRVYAIISGEK